MKDARTYLIRLEGHVDEDEINALSPLAITVQSAGQAASWLAACCDQSGLIGLLRHLHGLGFVVLSVTRLDGA